MRIATKSVVAVLAAALLVVAGSSGAMANTKQSGSKDCPSTYNVQKSVAGIGTVTHTIYSDDQYGEYAYSYYNTSASTTRTSRWNGTAGLIFIRDGGPSSATGTNVTSATLTCA